MDVLPCYIWEGTLYVLKILLKLVEMEFIMRERAHSSSSLGSTLLENKVLLTFATCAISFDRSSLFKDGH